LGEGLSNLREAKAKCTTKSEEGDLTLELDELGARSGIEKEKRGAGKTLVEAVNFFSGSE